MKKKKHFNFRQMISVVIVPLMCIALFAACDDPNDFFDLTDNNPEEPGEPVKVLVDASHGGGGWWFPQAGTFDPNQYHQGTNMVKYLEQRGFEVDELPRGAVITDAVLEDYEFIIRTGSYHNYFVGELDAYQKALDKGVCLMLITDHRTHTQHGDKLAEMLGLEFEGSVIEYIADYGGLMSDITKFASHPITEGMTKLEGIPGSSALMNAAENRNIEVLGWFSEDAYVDLNFNGVQDEDEPSGMPYMGVLEHPTSSIFWMTDINKIQSLPQGLTDNILQWFKDQHKRDID